GQPGPIAPLLPVRPYRAALSVRDLAGLVEGDPVPPAHVERQTVLDERLSTHAVPLPGGAHLEAVVPGKPQGVRDVPVAGDLGDAVNGGTVEMAGVVDEAAALLERQSGVRRTRRDARRPGLIHGRREDEVRLLLAGWCGGVLHQLAYGHDQGRCDRGGEREQQRASLWTKGSRVHW